MESARRKRISRYRVIGEGSVRISRAMLVCFAMAGVARADDLPAWAFANNPPGPKPAASADNGSLKRVTGSAVRLSLAQVRDGFNVPDWHPDDHPAAPDIVIHGRKPGVIACGYCHLPNGQGRPENAGLAGLNAAYIIQQIADFRAGMRVSSDPKLVPPGLMDTIAKAASDEEVKAAAEYFAGLQPKPWIRVVEAKIVPKTHITGYMLVPNADGATEPIGQRIVETPENVADTELRDSEAGFVAYVPPGSIARGERLVKTGGGKTTACGACHGADLKGLGPVPRLAGRSPSYIVRQLFDFRQGARAGLWSPLMQGVVRDLSAGDIVDIVAYTASRNP
jgi:cytochrome c553